MLGSILHSFYNGIENIFKIIGKNIDGKFPSGNHWHSELIKQMAHATNDRYPVIKVSKEDR
ncbi:ribonuclease toxin HepT-like protein [Desulfosporosinus burensis]